VEHQSNFQLHYKKKSNFYNLKIQVAEIAQCHINNLNVAEIFNHKFHRFYDNTDSMSHLTPSDNIIVYEMDSENMTLAPCIQRVIKRKLIFTSATLVGCPILIPIIKEKTTFGEIKKLIWDRMKHFLQDFESMTSTEIANCYKVKIINTSLEAIENQPKSDNEVISWAAKQYLTVDWAYSKLFEAKFKKNFPNDSSEIPSKTTSKNDEKKIKTINLIDCIKLWSKDEKLSVNDTWYCSKCKQHKQATKKLDLHKMPENLIIMLKRFVQVNKTFKDKIQDPIEFPLTGLNLADFVPNKLEKVQLYDLYAVVNHFGGGMNGGHYTAFCRNDKNWYEFDDSTCNELKTMPTVSPNVYVLFYKKKK